MTLENFPRGGKKPVTKKINGPFFGKKDVFTKPKKKQSKKWEDPKKPEKEIAYIANTAEYLTHSSLVEGMVLLGRIQSTTEYDLLVSLPGRLTGRVEATDVSESYTNLLRSVVNEDDTVDKFKPLSELYTRGKYVVCYVKSVNNDGKWKILLSLEPELINRNLDPAQLCKGSKVIGTVSSVEEHGYVIDTGINSFRCFLGMKDIDDGVKYYPGKQLFCAVKKLKTEENSTTAQLTTKVKHVATAFNSETQSLDSLVPGAQFPLTIQKILSNGIQVSFNKGYIGYVNRIYMEQSLESYEVGTTISGVLMYVMPTVKFAYFTLLSSDEGKERIDVGEVFDKARVSYIGTRNIAVTLKKGIRGVIPFQRTDIDFEKIPAKFSINSTHKCRVLAYDLFQQTYVCTTQREVLKEKFFSASSFKPGDRLKVEIAKIQSETGFVMVKVGKVTGWVAPEHIRDPEEKRSELKVGDTVDARYLGQDRKQKGILFTLKKSLVKSKLPVLADIAEAKVGKVHHATIVKIHKKGILVTFYDQIKGRIPSKVLDPKELSSKWNFLIGQSIAVKIESIDRNEGHLSLSVFKDGDEEQETTFEIGESVEGIVVDASVEGVHLRITKDGEKNAKIGFLPTGHISPCEEIGSYLASRCTIGETMSALVFSTNRRLLLSRTFIPRQEHREFKRLSTGDCIPCSIHEISDEGLKLVMPINNYNEYGIVPSSNVEHIDSLRPHQIVFASITSIDRKTRRITLTTSLSGVWNSSSSNKDNDLMASVDVLSLYFNKLQELRDHAYYREKSISKIKIGERVKAVVDKVTDYGLVLKLDNELIGTVRKDHYKGKINVGDTVNGTIFWINYIHELVEVTLLPNMINAISAKQKSVKVSIENQLRGDIILVTNWFVLVVLKGVGKGMLAGLPVRRHLNDVQPNLSPYSIGKRIRCYIVLDQSETGLFPICLVKSSFEAPKIIASPLKSLKRKSEESEQNEVKKKKKIIKEDIENGENNPPKKKVRKNIEKVKSEAQVKEQKSNKRSLEDKNKTLETEEETENEKTKRKKLIKKKKDEEMPVEASSVVKNEKKKAKLKKKKNKNKSQIAESPSADNYSESDDDDVTEENGIPECGFFWDNVPTEKLNLEEESSSDEDDEAEPSQRKKKKKMSAAERREAERQKEREIREREEALASNEAPNSVDQFDRLVLASPDSSMIWLQYMAYHLQATEIEKARAVAKRAIKTINFREETERLNIWQAWMNLESRFGSLESLNNVFQEAVRTNDARSIYLHMLTVHVDAARQAELEKLVTTIIGKFKQVPDVWYECGAAYLKIGLKDKSRHIMQRAIQSLPPQEHVNLMVKFAQLESKFGDKERAETLFEQILSSYPKRVDVWSSYVDALVKSGNTDSARKVLEKAILQTLPARKMKTLFKKFIDFEQKHGTPDGVTRVQELAVKYVENECKKDTA